MAARMQLGWVPDAMRRITLPDAVEVARILVLFLLAEVAVRILRLPTAARLFRVPLGSTSPSDPDPTPFPDWVRRRVRLVRKVSHRWPGDGLCLRESLVAGQRLRSLDPRLHVGVRREGTTVRAHAWITVSGRCIDPTAAQFQELGWA